MTSEKGDEATIGPGEAGRSDLPAKKGQLLAEHDDLGILRSCVPAADTEPFCETPGGTVNIGEFPLKPSQVVSDPSSGDDLGARLWPCADGLHRRHNKGRPSSTHA